MDAVKTSSNVDGFIFFDAQSWLPVYGLWCGPGWSAGQRDAQMSVSQMIQSPVLVHPNGVESVVDAICKAHDIAYAQAAGQPNEASLVADADVALLEALSAVDFHSLPSQESAYATFMAFAFYQKLVMIDLPRMGFEAVWNKIKALAAWVASKLAGLSGLSYTDAFGDTITGSILSGNAEGLNYVIHNVNTTKANGKYGIFTSYKDAYQTIYSGFDSAYAYDPSLGAMTVVWVDGTITIVEGTRQVQLSSPSASGLPQPLPGTQVNPIPGTGQDPSAARFFWNGLYMYDGTKWTYGGSGDFDAWVCVDNECVGVPKGH